MSTHLTPVTTSFTSFTLSRFRTVLFLLIWTLISCRYMHLDALTDPSSLISDPLFSHPEQVARLPGENENAHALLKYFQPVSGQLASSEIDLTAIGAEPVALQRILLSPHVAESYHKNSQWDLFYLHNQVARPGNGWIFLPQQCIQAQVGSGNRMMYYVTHSSGVTLGFCLDSSTKTFVLDMDAYGMHNGTQGLPSSQYDYRNSTLVFDSLTGDMVFTAPNGVQYFYTFPAVSLCRFHSNTKGYLAKVRLRNGRFLRYSYDAQNRLVTRIESVDPTETHIYATLSFSREAGASSCTTMCQSNTGAKAVWEEEIFTGKVTLRQKIKNGKEVWKGPLARVSLLRSIHSSQNGESSFAYKSRFICSDFTTKEGKLRAEYALFGSGLQRHYRIKTLLREDEKGIYQPLYHFDYNLAEVGKRGGSTTIQLVDGSCIVYQINEKLLVDSITWKNPAGNSCKEERFIWNAQQWCERKELYADNQLISTHTYSYDLKGNPLEETVSGNLTGHLLDGLTETTRIRRTYSQDALAVLLSEEKDNGRLDRYSYLPGTDLLQSHLVYNTPESKQRLCKRTFFVYNAQNQLIEKQIDNGSSEQMECLENVTERHTTCWKLRQQSPFLHLPEQKEEYVLDQGEKVCVARFCYTYDAEGNVATEEHYDGQGQCIDRLAREYDAKGNVIAETNHLGQKAAYRYDSYGRKIEEVPFSADRKIEWLWDNQGRCTAKVVTGFDGIETRRTFSYDVYDEQTKEIGPCGESTERIYDPLLGQLNYEQKPSTFSLGGVSRSVSSHYVYDGLNRLILQRNANGSTIKTQYTAHGKPHTIIHPDGTKERFQYTLDGRLERYTDREGTQTDYQWDIWDRIVAKSYRDAQGHLLAQESWEYNAFHLLRKTDKEGHVTEYTYDAQGRKVQEEAAPRCTRWKYDARGDVKEIIYVSAGNSLHVHMQRDRLGRVVETHFKDIQGLLLKWEGVSYDLAGRVATRESLRDGQRIVESFTYDSQDRLISYQDCNGAITTTQYGETTHLVNGKACRFETKRTTSSEGEVTEIMYDHAEREWVCDQWDPKGRHLLRKENEYDPEGNLLYQRKWLDDEAGNSTLHTIARTYTPDGLVASSTRAAGSDCERTTKYVYSPEGRLLMRQEPSKRSIHYTYDGLGCLSSIQASDQTVNQQLQYNRLGHFIKSVDGTTGLQVLRTVDRFGSVLSETFPFGKELSRQYDARGRLQELEATGLGSTRYTYDSLFLRSVEKISPQGEPVALHRYTDYDLDGWLNQELLAGGVGSISYRRDAKGRLVERTTPHGTLSQSFDAQDRLISRTEEGNVASNQSSSVSYTYDGLSQLISEESAEDAQTHLYDMQGSRLQKNGEPYEVNVLCEELRSGTHQFAYDLDGNRIEKTDLQSGDSWIYHYNALGQCTEAYSSTCRVQFAYDAFSRKSRRIVEKREGASENWSEVDRLYFLYQGNEEIGAYRETGESTSYRVLAYLEDSIIPRTVYMELDNKWYVPQQDAQGSITHLIDPRTAAIASLKRYTAFGEVLRDDFVEGSLGVEVSSPWGYFSKRLDPDLGLIDFGKRWYDPQQARWTTLDPAGFIDGTNLYRFVKNNPLLYNDPDGQFAIAIPIFQATSAAFTWFCSTETFLAIVATATAAYGLYKYDQYLDERQDAERRQAMLEERYYGPVYSVNHSDRQPTAGTEEEEDPGDGGSCPNERKVGVRKWPSPGKGRVVENGIEYTTHALERMAPRGLIQDGSELYSRGIPSLVVENAIKCGAKRPGNSPQEIAHIYDNIRVITNLSSKRVISVSKVKVKNNE